MERNLILQSDNDTTFIAFVAKKLRYGKTIS